MNPTAIQISPRICSRPNPARTTRPLSKTPTILTKALTITAGLRWDIFGGKTERHNRLEYFNPTATNTASGVSLYRRRSLRQRRQSLSVHSKPQGLRPAAWLFMAARQSSGRPWRRRLLLTVPARIWLAARPRQRRILGRHTVECHLLQRRRQHGNQRHRRLRRSCTGRSRHPVRLDLIPLSNPFPNGVVPQLTAPPAGLANNLGHSAQHRCFVRSARRLPITSTSAWNTSCRTRSSSVPAMSAAGDSSCRWARRT